MSRVVVVGGGFAGWLAAIALEGRVSEVVLVERDLTPDRPTPRRGGAQGGQLHNLLGRGQLHVEELAPGFLAALRGEGCGYGNVSTDTEVFELGIDMPRRPLDIDIYAAPRPRIDHVLARMATEVDLVDGVTATDLVGTEHRITGVRCRGPLGPRTIEADLVVDASGPASLAARWLAGRRVEVPTTELDVAQWYVSSVVELDEPSETDGRGDGFAMVFPHGEESTGGLLSPAGDGTHYLSVSGRSRDPMPRTFDEVLEVTGHLGSGCIAARLSGATLVREPAVYRKLVASWRRFDQVAMPQGLVVIGDSVAALNPLFGQGMSVAAWQVSMLAAQDLLADGGTDGFASAAAAVVDQAWSLGRVVSESIEGVAMDGSSVDLTGALAAEIADDAVLHEQYVRIWHLLESPSLLGRPEVVERLVSRWASSVPAHE